ncbi:hypothetical protein Taro_042425 [Colocasia esculenta]|uniref:Acyl-coenzyme A thioesterase 13 n=1 Tax=Colocasia esculenta TaxID=4460 RepID=A0A843WPK2_COLES|nr:hypothetical protein [Colocasia esculenta]
MPVLSRGGEDDRAAAARKLLEDWAADPHAGADRAGSYAGIIVWQLQVLRARGGRALCAFTVPRYLTDGDGNWRAGAIAALIDNVGAAAIVSSSGILDVSVDFTISYFSPAKAEEEVEIEAAVLGHHGKVSCVEVIIRKKDGGALVAVGKQWMSSNIPTKSKL